MKILANVPAAARWLTLRPMPNVLQRALRAQAEGKALGAHPALMSADPISTYALGAARQDATLSQREAARHVQAYGGDQAIDWIMDCVRLYADTTSTAEWHLERDGKRLLRTKNDGSPADSDTGPADLYELLDKPNPFMLYDELVDLLVIDLLLVGNAYWYKHNMTSDGKPLALYRCAPAYMKLVPGPQGPKRYEYQPPGTKSPLKLQPEQVMHFKLPNPHSAYYGLGVIQGGGRSFDLELALTDRQASYYENAAEPSMIVQSERRVPRDVFHKLRAQLTARASGSRRSGDLLVLEAGLKADTLSPSAQQALFDVMTKLSRDRIFAMFRCAPVLMGIMDESSGSNKVADARREFDNKTMRPFLDKLQRRVSTWLCEPWNVDFKIDYNYVMPQEDVVEQGSKLAAIPGIKVRELRRFLRPIGVEESTGDAEIDEMVLNLPGEDLTNGADPNAIPDRNLAGEPGRPPNAGNTRAFPRGAQARQPQGKAIDFDDIERRMRIAEVKAVQLREQQPFKLVGPDRPSDLLAGTRDADVDAAVGTITRGLRDGIHLLERDLMDHAEGKALDANLVRKIRTSSAWPAFENSLWDSIESGVAQAVSTASVHQGSLGREANLDYEEIARRISHRPEGGVPTIIQNLKDETLKIVEDAAAANKSTEEIQTLIGRKMQTWRDGHIHTIALTEATHGYNAGTLAVASANGISRVLVEDGHDHDAECAAADGSVWTIDHADRNRIEHPRCRRAFTLLEN